MDDFLLILLLTVSTRSGKERHKNRSRFGPDVCNVVRSSDTVTIRADRTEAISDTREWYSLIPNA